MANYISQITLPNSTTYTLRDRTLNIYSGSCATAAATEIKDVTCPELTTLTKGAVIFVTFTYTNTAAVGNLKLRVNSSVAADAKPIKHQYNASESNIPDKGYIRANQTYQFYYDGTNWVMVTDYNTNSTQFTITANATDGYWDLTGTNGTNAVTYALAPYSSKQTGANFYTGDTAPDGTTRLNYNGYLYATKLYSGGSEVLTAHRTYTAFAGKPTGNQTPGFGSTFTIQQISQSTTGQVSGTDRTVTIPSTIATNSAVGLVKPWYSHTANSTGPTTGTDATAVIVNAITTTASRYYAIEEDKSGRLFVNVPWTDQNVTQTADTSNADIPVLLKGVSNSGSAGGVKYPNTTNKIVSVNPSTGTVNAANIYTTITKTNKLMNNNDGAKIRLCDNSLVTTGMNKVGTSETLTSSTGDAEWLKVLLKILCATYTQESAYIYRGTITPNSVGYYEIYIYNTNDIDSNGLPRYSYGTFRKYGTSFYVFGTSDFTFYCTAISQSGHNHNSAYLTAVGYDSANKKIYYTKNGSNTDVVTFGSNAFNSTSYLPLAGGTMTGHLKFSGNDSRDLTWEDGTWYQRILVTDDSTSDTAVFTFQQTGNSGTSWTDLLTIKDNGNLITPGNIQIGNTGARSISYKGTKATYSMIKFIDNTSDTYGNGISIGGGGLVIVGSGESSDTIASGKTGGDEVLYLGSDGAAYLYTNVQSGLANAKTFTFGTDGILTATGFSGSGASLTSLNGSNISSGTVADARIDSSIARLASPAFTGTPTAPTAANGTSTTQIATTEFVNNTLSYVNAMQFKGTLGTGGTITALPATHEAGDTYRVKTAGTYAGNYCEVGTLIICVKDGTTAADADWTSVETNEDGTVIGPTSSTNGNIVLFDGTSGRIIKNSSYSPSSFAAASHGNHVPTTQTANNITFLRNDNSWFKLTKNEVNTLINLLDTGSSDLTANDYVITQYVGGGTTTTTYHRRPANKVINAGLVKAALGTVSTTAKKFLKDTGDWVQVDWSDLTGKPSSFTPSSHTHYELATIGDQRSTATTPNTYKNRFIFQGLKTNTVINSPYTDTYSYLIGLRGWSDSSGGNSHELAFNGNGIYRRQGATDTWGNWTHLLDSGNTYAANSNGAVVSVARNTDTTIATINGVTVKIKIPASDNTWRPIGTGANDAMAGNTNVNNVSQGTTTTSNWRKILLSGQDYAGYNTAVGNDQNTVTYRAVGVSVQPSTGSMQLAGGLELHGHIAGDANTTGHGLYSGGAYHNAYNNIILHGDSSTGSSGIAFISDKGSTSINQPSDRAFIQYHAHGVSTITAENTAPTLSTSGELGRLVIGVGNDAGATGSGDQLYLQTRGHVDVLHLTADDQKLGVIPDTGNTTGSVGGTTTPVYVEGGVIKSCTAYANASVSYATSAGKISNLASGDSASNTATQRYVWFSYDDNTTGRPAHDSRFTYQTSTGTLSIGSCLDLRGATNNTMSNATTNPRIRFSENGGQAVYLAYTDYDAYRASKGLKVVDADGSDASNVWFEVQGNAYAAKFVGPLEGNASSANQLKNSKTLWGQSFDGSANVTGNMTNVGPSFTLPSGNTTFSFYNSSSNPAIGRFGRLGLSTDFSKIDTSNCILHVNGSTQVADMIYRTSAASDENPMLYLNAAGKDAWLWQVSNGTTNHMYYGYGLKYLSSGQDALKYLELIADNSNGTEVIALAVDQFGHIGIGGLPTNQYNLTITGGTNFNGIFKADGLGIGIDADDPSTVTSDYHIAKFNGSILITTGTTTKTSVAHLDVVMVSNNPTLDFYPHASTRGNIGKSSYRWANGYFSNSVSLSTTVSNVATSITLNATGTATLVAANPQITFTPNSGNSWAIKNAAGTLQIGNNSGMLSGSGVNFAITSRLFVNTTIPTSPTTNFYVTGTSQLQGAVGINTAAESISGTGTDEHILKINGSTLIVIGTNSVAHLDVVTESSTNLLKFTPAANNQGQIGTDTLRWKYVYAGTEINVKNSNTGFVATSAGAVTISAASPSIALTSTTTNALGWTISNANGTYTVSNGTYSFTGEANGFKANRLYINYSSALSSNLVDFYVNGSSHITTALGIGIAPDTTHKLLVSGSTKLDGNVGIGAAASTGTNAHKLYVKGTSKFDGASYYTNALYFANGTTYYVDSSANAKFANLELTGTLTMSNVTINNAAITGNFLPSAHNTYTLGSSSKTWSAAYIGSSASYGATNKPIYWNNGVPAAISGNIGSSSQPIYISGGVLTASTGTVGSNVQPIYMSGGTLTATTQTVGSGTNPIFLSGGSLTASSSNVGNAYTPVYLNSGTLTAVTLVQKIKWSMDNTHKSVKITHNSDDTAFAANSIIIDIIVTSGESYLTAPITWKSGDNYIALNTSTAVTGTVSGYVLVVRGTEVAATDITLTKSTSTV